MGFCIVRGCKSRSDSNNRGRKFHVVPRDNELREKWILAIGRSNLPKSGSVCSRHFLPEDYQLSRSGLSESLTKTAIPSLHLVPAADESDDDVVDLADCGDDDADLNQYYSEMDFENETTFKEFSTAIDTLDLEKEKDLPALTCVDLFPDPPHLIAISDEHQRDGSIADDEEFEGFRTTASVEDNKEDDDAVQIISDDIIEPSISPKQSQPPLEEGHGEVFQKIESPSNPRSDVRSTISIPSAPVSPASYFSSAESVASTTSTSKKSKKRYCRECDTHFRKTRELLEHLKTHVKMPDIRVERLSDDNAKVKEYLCSLSPKPSPTHGSLKLKFKLLDSQNFEVVPSESEEKPSEEATKTDEQVLKAADIRCKAEVPDTPDSVDTFSQDIGEKLSNPSFLPPESRYFECPTFDGLGTFADDMLNTGEGTEDLLKKLLEINKEPPMYQKEADWSSNANEFISIDSLAPRCNICHMNFSHPKYLYEHKQITGHDFHARITDHGPNLQPDYGHHRQNAAFLQPSHPPPQNMPPLHQMAQMRGNFTNYGPRLNVRMMHQQQHQHPHQHPHPHPHPHQHQHQQQQQQQQQHHPQPSPPPGFHPSQCMMTRTPPPLYRMNGNPPNFPQNRYLEKRPEMFGPTPPYLNGSQQMNDEMMRQPIFLRSRWQKAVRGRSQGPPNEMPTAPGILTKQTAIRPRFLGPTPQMPGQMQFQRARVQSPPKQGEQPPSKKMKLEPAQNQFSPPLPNGMVSPGISNSQGMPVIQSVQSGVNASNFLPEKPKESPPNVVDAGNAGGKPGPKNPKDVANILATRGITVTHKGKTSFVSLANKGGNATNASAQEAVQKLQANNSVSIISKKKPNEMSGPKSSGPSTEGGNRVTTKFLSCPVITCKEKFLTIEGVNRHAFRWHGIPMLNTDSRLQKRMIRCRLCHHLCSSQENLQEHIRREHEPSVNEIGIPIVDLRNDEVKRKLAGLGIFNYVPLTAAGASTSSLAFPVVSVQGASNPSICNILGLGASSVLSLGPVKSISVRKANSENK